MDKRIVELPSRTPRLAGRFPFRLGATSYVVPADLQTNLHALAGVVDDIEVVLFESDSVSNLPTLEVVNAMVAIRKEFGTSYTIHFPLDISLGSPDPQLRKRSVEQCRRIIQLMACTTPFGYVLHLPCDTVSRSNKISRYSWQQRACDAIGDLLSSDLASEDICVETLSYPFEWVYPVIEQMNLSVCLDIGHVLINNYNLARYYRRYFDKTRIVHLHGINEHKDHQSLSYLSPTMLRKIVHSLSEPTAPARVLTMEVFDTPDFISSAATMEDFLT